MRLENLLRRIARRRRLKFGTIYARIIDSQPLPGANHTGPADAECRTERRYVNVSK